MGEDKKLKGELVELKKLLAEAEKQSEESLAGWQRARADYANLKKETERRQKDIIQFVNAALMAELLPVYNHFKLALSHIPKNQKQESWVIGIEHIKKQFQDFFKKYKIEEIKTIGEKFDHNLHEAVAHEKRDDFEEDVVFEEIQPGYTLGGEVINPAKVKVAK
jgi:molecular chaperone GrpE